MENVLTRIIVRLLDKTFIETSLPGIMLSIKSQKRSSSSIPRAPLYILICTSLHSKSVRARSQVRRADFNTIKYALDKAYIPGVQ